jgi:hypothetical protein
VAVYRGVFLYGDSGNGKSSLVNAGLLPQARRLGFEPVGVRVQPRAGEELVIEPIEVSDDGAELLPSPLVPEAERGAARVVLSIAEFEEQVRAASQEHRPLLVFDHFEEILTLFEDDAARTAVAAMIVRLLGEPLPVKLLFAFREDYLGRVKQLLGARPELIDQALRLGPPSNDALETIIRGPFERFPGHFERELDPELTRRLRAALTERFGTGDVSLSEVQTVCLRLWESADPGALLAARGVQGVLEDELGEALNAFSPELRAAAVALLGEMVTATGTRNFISAEDLRQRIREEDEQIAPALLDEALGRLAQESRLVRRERRRDLYLYEITSEFLVPWISQWREELRLVRERERRERRRLVRILGWKADRDHLKAMERARRETVSIPEQFRPRVIPARRIPDRPQILSETFDVCLSFAGEQRDYVERIAAALKAHGLHVFYDQDKDIAAALWGRDLGEVLDYVYREGSRFCLMFISADYAAKAWTRRERRSALARAVEQDEYVLPARFDDTELPGFRPTIGYVDLREIAPATLVEFVLRKSEGRGPES